ncbi:hypothetical protein H9L39_19264 [Fusarium oxysporum f. sp. albedinis]|nr:hypothetical protein H9L39_19264 [Fusarium oxysporum f. sp. albedinis]
MGGAFGTVDDVILDFRGRGSGKLSVRCGTVSGGGAETAAQGQRGASRRDLRVLKDEKKMLLKTLKCCRNAIRDVGQFAAS